jgi:hypothetical protein
MVASDTFAEFLREQLAPLGRITMRRMFGKTGVFCDGAVFGIPTGRRKAPPDDRLRRRLSIPEAAVIESISRGVLDRPPEPVIGRAFARPVGGRRRPKLLFES